MLARTASRHVVVTKHMQVSFYHRLPVLMRRKLNSPLLLFSDLGANFPDQKFHLIYCSPQKPTCGHLPHIQGQAHVGLFQLYPTSFSYHSCSHVENLQNFSCVRGSLLIAVMIHVILASTLDYHSEVDTIGH